MYISKRRIAARVNYLVATSAAERKQAAGGLAACPRVFSKYQANIRISFAEICAKYKIIYCARKTTLFRRATQFARKRICRFP